MQPKFNKKLDKKDIRELQSMFYFQKSKNLGKDEPNCFKCIHYNDYLKTGIIDYSCELLKTFITFNSTVEAMNCEYYEEIK